MLTPDVAGAAASLVLVPELIPGPLWGHSGARLLPTSRWRRIRQAELDRAGGRCEVCGRPQAKGLIAHERWHHMPDGPRGAAPAVVADPDVPTVPRGPTALLWSIRMQCRACDSATHIGLADSQGRGAGARATLARVNGISRTDVEALIEGAYERWAQLSALSGWRVVVNPPLLEVHPDLAAVQTG